MGDTGGADDCGGTPYVVGMWVRGDEHIDAALVAGVRSDFSDDPIFASGIARVE
ncbi:MAG TPA: hypothetical protein VF656_19005 [Pyrinomonadaceae bacterium]|jgi:hypothetical protein